MLNELLAAKLWKGPMSEVKLNTTASQYRGEYLCRGIAENLKSEVVFPFDGNAPSNLPLGVLMVEMGTVKCHISCKIMHCLYQLSYSNIVLIAQW